MSDTSRLTVTILRAIDAQHGPDAAMQAAREMIVAAAAVLGCEEGPIEVATVCDLVCKAQWPLLELVG